MIAHFSRLRLRTAVFLTTITCLALTGCSDDLETNYGQRRGATASQSVNGTAVLGQMFEQAGHSVFSWPTLSPKLQQRADCIVWFPDDFQPPSEEVRDWLNDWLWQQPGRTLIYVGRDFDAEAWYWEKVETGTPPEQLANVRKRKNAAKNEFQTDRVDKSEDCDWFEVDGTNRPRDVRTLHSDYGWLDGVDPAKVEIQLNGRMTESVLAYVLLESDGDALVTREDFDGSQLIVVANGSFLLNVPLVNHEHRKLAGKLIDELGRVGPESQTVVFLESGNGGPSISEKDPSAATPTGLEILTVWPICWIFVHMAVVGVAFCFSRWPIFGLPRELPPDSPSDFGKHIQALAKLLQRSGDRAYASTRVLHYQQTTKSSE